MSNGFKETKEMIQFVISLVRAIEKSIKDGVSVMDTLNFIAPALSATAAFENMTEIPTELANLDEAEMQELYAVVAANLDQADKTEEVIKRSLEIGLKLFELYMFVKKS